MVWLGLALGRVGISETLGSKCYWQSSRCDVRDLACSQLTGIRLGHVNTRLFTNAQREGTTHSDKANILLDDSRLLVYYTNQRPKEDSFNKLEPTTEYPIS